MIPRYDYQRRAVLRNPGKILNMACKEDPAFLKLLAPKRVVNADLRDYDHDAWYNRQEKVPIPVDVVCDATVSPWPFQDDEFDCVILAEILEDLPDDGCQLTVLKEARRVGRAVCITTPEDTPERDWHHLTTTTEEKLRAWLDEAGWTIEDFQTVNYEFVPRGHFIYAVR